MFKSRPVPPLNQWIKVPRANWHFPVFEPPKIGPRLPLPIRPRLFSYHLKKGAYRGLALRTSINQRFSNPLIARLKNQNSVLDRVLVRQRKQLGNYVHFGSSRVKPYKLKPPKMSDEFWKHGFKIPAPSQYAIGCRRPTKHFALPTSEMHFRLMHPQFGSLFDKWAQPGINLSDPRNIGLVEAELDVVMNSVRNQRTPLYKNKISSLKRPFAYAAFVQRFVLTAHHDEAAFIRQNARNPEALNLGKDRMTRQIIQIAHDLDEHGLKKVPKK